MSDDFNRINDLINTNKKPGQSYIHEVIERSPEELESFNAWKSQNKHHKLVQLLKDQLLDSADKNGPNIITVSSQSTMGFILAYDNANFTVEEFKYLFDLLKDAVLELGYINKLADRRVDFLDDSVQMKERYYFKPKFSFDEDLMKGDQGFGNLTLELLFIDEQPKQLKFHRNIYSDRNYHPAKPYDQLITDLLHSSSF